MYLIEQSRKQESDTVELIKTKASLAEYFGVSRPSLERELTNMQQEGLIAAERRRITILRKTDLIQLVCR
ncbi:helix-turn-helix domain-containing protein [Alistipes sp.]|nr:helix-turn-helix domain-containing protein [Alistipes sp.]